MNPDDETPLLDDAALAKAELAGITLTDNPPHPTWKIELLGEQKCHCGEKLYIGNLLTSCPRYRRIGDDHVLRPNPRVVDSRGNFIKVER